MQISNDWFVAETEFENKSFIIRGRLFLDAIRQSGKFATRIALVWEYQERRRRRQFHQYRMERTTVFQSHRRRTLLLRLSNRVG